VTHGFKYCPNQAPACGPSSAAAQALLAFPLRNLHGLEVTVALANLFMARRRLLNA
jgi:hypothetical protein